MARLLTFRVRVELVRIGHQRTVVRRVGDAIVVRIVVAGVAYTVAITVLLARVGGVHAVVHATLDVLHTTSQVMLM